MVITIFTTIKIGIYKSISMSICLLLVHIVWPRGTFLECVVLHDKSINMSHDVFIPWTPHTFHLPIPPIRLLAPYVQCLLVMPAPC